MKDKKGSQKILSVREEIVSSARERLRKISIFAASESEKALKRFEAKAEKAREKAIKKAEAEREHVFRETERKILGTLDVQESNKTRKLEERMSRWLPPTFDEPRTPEKLLNGDDAWMAKHMNSISAIRDWDREQEGDEHPFAWRSPRIYGRGRH